ncbi:MAG: hypothetical protein ABIK83_15845 [Candidatus Zixiibacteriota bacterium]
MGHSISKSARRTGVVVNYGCLVALIALFYVGKNDGWNAAVSGGAAAVLLGVLVTFVAVHIKTNLWRLVHTKYENLDERQIQVTHESLRHSYSIFTVIILVVLLGIALASEHNRSLTDHSMLMVIFAGQLYLAHTLPSSIIAWTEREV